MDELVDIIKTLEPEMTDDEIKQCKILVSGGYLDSFDIVSLVEEINIRFNVALPVDYMVPERFESVTDILEMIEKVKG